VRSLRLRPWALRFNAVGVFDGLTIHAEATCNPGNTEGKSFTALPYGARLAEIVANLHELSSGNRLCIRARPYATMR